VARASLPAVALAKGGGFIACRYPDEPAIGLDPKWKDIACGAFVEFGGWKGDQGWQAS
jgi:hypothetical protein